VEIEIQPLVDAIYERSRYSIALDYSRECKPPIEPGEVEWLAGRVSSDGGSVAGP